MKKEQLNEKLYVEYDKDKYQIETYNEIAILKRIEDNKIIKVFENACKIIQQRKDNKNYFIVIIKNNNIILQNYSDNEYYDELYLEGEFKDLQDIKILGSNSYLLCDNNNLYFLYNLKERSNYFNEAYSEKKINDILRENVVMTVTKKSSLFDNSIKDTIIYGINPETYKIVTPIWSELQQRFIEIYKDDQLKGYSKNFNCDQITIAEEIQKYLDLMQLMKEKENTLYKGIFNDQLNEKFVKKFVK